jgi:flagellar basal-body rod protein FlgG
MSYASGATSETTVNPTGSDIGLGVRLSGVQKNFLQGNLENSGNPFDLAISGNGFFKVLLPSGDTAFTRDGSFKLDSEGYMVTGDGYRLEPAIGQFDTDISDVSISSDGVVTATVRATGEKKDIGQIEISKFMNPAGLSPLGGNLFQISEASGDEVVGKPTDPGFGSLSQGFIEGSNVQLVEEMVSMITAQRAYESNSKTIAAADEMLQTATNIKK